MADDRAFQLLHIYDSSDSHIQVTAWARRHGDVLAPFQIFPVPIDDGVTGLWSALKEILNRQLTFSRVLVETHGNVGKIFFGGEAIDAAVLNRMFAGHNFDKIFPYVHARMYFNGCNIADDDRGWDFLDTAGQIFLRMGGGVVFAQTNLGHEVLVWSHLLTGHVVHLGKTCYSIIAPGGVVLGHSTD